LWKNENNHTREVGEDLMQLRDYQIDLLNKTVSAFKEGKRRVLVVAPCG
jgi:superfamily II DNA or RNA helicase